MNAWLGIALVLTALGLLFGTVRALSSQLSAELSRKTVHITMGLICLSFPWIFTDNWPVILLAALAVSALLAVRVIPQMNRELGSVLGRVERVSLGEIYFPIAVAATFVWAQGNHLVYSIPVLMLTLADAMGALIGQSYGKHTYNTLSGWKSREGSVAFFAVAFMCIHVPILLFTPVGRAESLLISLLLASLMMLAEAASWRGLDNLFIPLAGCGLLMQYLPLDALALGWRLVTLWGVLAVSLWLHRRLTLDGGALALAIILCYTCSALMGWRWLIAPVVVLLSYTIPSARTEHDQHKDGLNGVLCLAITGLFWVFSARMDRNAALLFPFTVCLAAHLTLISILWQTIGQSPRPVPCRVISSATCWGGALCMLPYVFLSNWNNPYNWIMALFGTVLIGLAATGFWWWKTASPPAVRGIPRWTVQGALAWGISFLAWIVQYHV